MAKNTQEAEVIVTMNGQAAMKAVAELAQEYEKLQKEALEAYKAGNDALGKKLDAQAQKLMKDIEITRRETKKFADVMKNINGASLKELNSAAKQLFHVFLSKMSFFFSCTIEKSPIFAALKFFVRHDDAARKLLFLWPHLTEIKEL